MDFSKSDILHNPFSSVPGAQPHVFVGRESQLNDYEKALIGNVADPSRFLILEGPQGSGKTTLLNKFSQISANHNFAIVRVGCYEAVLDDAVEQLELFLGSEVATDVLRKFAEPPTWRGKMSALIDAAADAGHGVSFLLDDLNGACEPFWDLVRLVSECVQDGKNITFVAAGDLAIVGDCLERGKGSFFSGLRRVGLGRLSDDEVAQCLQQMVESAGRSISANALELAAGAAHGYALMAQLIGYHSWSQHPNFPRISREDVLAGIEGATQELFGTLFDPQVGALSDKDRQFLLAVAQGEGPTLMADVAAALDVSTGYARMYKIRLVDAGLIYAPRRGYVDFAVPLLRSYLQKL